MVSLGTTGSKAWASTGATRSATPAACAATAPRSTSPATPATCSRPRGSTRTATRRSSPSPRGP
eukprot:516073-Pyramimonas_sp.AAC.1